MRIDRTTLLFAVAAALSLGWALLALVLPPRSPFPVPLNCSSPTQQLDCQRARAYVAADFAFAEHVDRQRDPPPATGLPYATP